MQQTLATAVMHTIRQAGYPLKWEIELQGGNPKENGGKRYWMEIRCPVSDMTYIVVAPTLTEAAVGMAIKLGFDLEE